MRPDPKVAPLLKRASFSKLLRIVDLPAPGLPTTSMFVLGVAESPVGNILYFIKNYYIFIIILLYFPTSYRICAIPTHCHFRKGIGSFETLESILFCWHVLGWNIYTSFFFYVCWVPWRINWMKNVVYITLLLKKSIFKSCNSCIKPRLLNPNILKHTRIIQTTCQQIFPSKNMVWQEDSWFYCNSIFKSCNSCIKPRLTRIIFKAH